MNLTLFFRLIVGILFQRIVISSFGCKTSSEAYGKTLFFCPRVYCNDGFNISLQIHNGNYCTTENGYQTFGLTFESVEFGFPSSREPKLDEYSEEPGNLETVGRIPINIIQEICDSHNGIDWDKTISQVETHLIK